MASENEYSIFSLFRIDASRIPDYIIVNLNARARKLPFKSNKHAAHIQAYRTHPYDRTAATTNEKKNDTYINIYSIIFFVFAAEKTLLVSFRVTVHGLTHLPFHVSAANGTYMPCECVLYQRKLWKLIFSLGAFLISFRLMLFPSSNLSHALQS